MQHGKKRIEKYPKTLSLPLSSCLPLKFSVYKSKKLNIKKNTNDIILSGEWMK